MNGSVGRKILDALRAAKGEFVSVNALMEAVYGPLPEWQCRKQDIRQAVATLRRNGWTIITDLSNGKYGSKGYRLEGERE